jgi:hypothetical protein
MSTLLRDGRTVYELGDIGTNLWWAQVQGPHMPEAELEAIAKRIVLCCNLHDELLAALKAADSAIIDACGALTGYGDVCELAAERLRKVLGVTEAAIAKLRAEQRAAKATGSQP